MKFCTAAYILSLLASGIYTTADAQQNVPLPKQVTVVPIIDTLSGKGKLCLEVKANEDCELFIDSVSYGMLKGGKVKNVCLSRGLYSFMAKSPGNQKDIFTAQMKVRTVELNGIEPFDIDMQSVRYLNRLNNGARTEVMREVENAGKNMVRIQGDTFSMGGTGGFDGKPDHPVCVNSFKLCKYDVTEALWTAVMQQNPSAYNYCSTCPVENISWFDALEFIKKLDSLTGRPYRLPTEAEWEFAARGGILRRGYVYSGSNTLDSVAWNEHNDDLKPMPVGRLHPNELGLYDMSGNVWNWCSDWYDLKYYSNSPFDNPEGPSTGRYRVMRGGDFSQHPEGCRVAYRSFHLPDARFGSYGLRLAEDW